MAYTLTTITTKPTAAAWYRNSSETSAAESDAYKAWIKTNTGFVSSKSDRIMRVRPATHVATRNTSVWATRADYDAFVAARATQAYYIALQEYNLANGIVAIDSPIRG